MIVPIFAEGVASIRKIPAHRSGYAGIVLYCFRYFQVDFRTGFMGMASGVSTQLLT